MRTAQRVLVLNGSRHTHREETQCSSDSHKAHFWFPIRQEREIMTEKKEGEGTDDGFKVKYGWHIPRFGFAAAFIVQVILKMWLTCGRRNFWKDSERKDQRNTPSEEPQIAAWDTGWRQLIWAEHCTERNAFLFNVAHKHLIFQGH